MRIWLGLVVWLLLPLAGAAAQSFAPYPNHSQARLIASSAQISADHDTLIGLQVKLDPDWHAYWQNPGDSGAAPLLDFQSEAVTFSAVQWPVPRRIAVPPLMTFGYEGEVLWWVKARLRAPPRTTAPLAIKLEAEWLVCKVECIPAFDSLVLSLTPTQNTPAPGPAAAIFERYAAQLPQEIPLQAHYLPEDGALRLQVQGLPPDARELDFLPINNEVLGNQAPERDPAQPATLRLKLAQDLPAEAPAISGLLRWEGPQAGAAYVSLSPQPPAVTPLSQFLLMAFVGGVILNLMPCVFPMLAIKLLGLIRHAEDDPRTIRLHSAVYIAGVLVSFGALALLLAALRAGGQALGWGFQLQSPPTLIALIVLFYLIALNLWGLYEFRLPLAISVSPRQGPLWGQFSAGVLAVVVASPCTAPFMGAAMGFALAQPVPVLLAIFTALGLGFCLPYLLLLVSPKVVRWLPRPGAWMVLFKEAMGFPMLLSALWLLWVLARLVDSNGVMAVLLALVLLALPFWWALRRAHGRTPWLLWACVAPVCGFLLVYPARQTGEKAAASSSTPASVAASGADWQAFDPAQLTALRAQGPVFVNFTAAWCITCQVNEQVTFRQQDVRAEVARLGVAMVKADWTRRDPEITALLNQFGRISVPFYLLYLPGQNSPVILPELLTPELFRDTLNTHLAPT
ncbi:MAG: protein-disulfide reductase DsbD family protein [Candidatus Sericytochromatia bacterium]